MYNVKPPPPESLLRFGILLILAWLITGAVEIRGTGNDWQLYLDAGHHVGTLALLTQAHFVYIPGAAWGMWPFAHVPLAVGYFFYVALMVALTAAAAWLASKAYGISLSLAILMGLAWFPLTIAISLGQNSPIALFLTMLAIFAIAKRRDLLAGMATGLLLYKPNDAIPLLALFVILRQWRSLAIAGCAIPVWYLLSVGATGDWTWPVPFGHMFAAWYHYDATIDAVFAISIPGILLSLGAPAPTAVLVGCILFLVTLPLLAGVSRTEAASVVPLIGIACSPHAYGYEAILALPCFWLAASRLTVARSVTIWIAYLTAPIYVIARTVHFDILALAVIGFFVAWVYTRSRALLLATWSNRSDSTA
jgi:hypothetical protein